jgi:hypothetical protein
MVLDGAGAWAAVIQRAKARQAAAMQARIIGRAPSGTSPPVHQARRAKQDVEGMVALEILRLQTAAQVPLQTADAKAAALRLHVGRRPDRVAHRLDFRPVVEALRNSALSGVEPTLDLGPGRAAGRGVISAIDAKPRLGQQAGQTGRQHR